MSPWDAAPYDMRLKVAMAAVLERLRHHGLPRAEHPRAAALTSSWRHLRSDLEHYLRDGVRLARCRLTGGHRWGTWRTPDRQQDGRVPAQGSAQPWPSGQPLLEWGYVHTWCSRCGWCTNTQSFEEEDWWASEQGEEVAWP